VKEMKGETQETMKGEEESIRRRIGDGMRIT